MQFTFNGLGTSLYGKRDIRADGSHVTTEWFVIFFIPIIPLQSMRVLYTDNNKYYGFYSSNEYKVVEYLSISISQVINTYLYLGSYIIFVYLFFSETGEVFRILIVALSIVFIFVPTCLREREIKNFKKAQNKNN